MRNLFSFISPEHHRITVWYMSKEAFRAFSTYPFLKEKPTITLGMSHLPLVECYLPISNTEKEYINTCQKIFGWMQGENWSPNGEARNLIEETGIAHTSMSMGDIIQIDKRYFIASVNTFIDVSDKITLPF